MQSNEKKVVFERLFFILQAYVATGDSFDKSGGYGAQGVAGSFIESLDGDFFNVVGLPIQPLSACLRRIVEANF